MGDLNMRIAKLEQRHGPAPKSLHEVSDAQLKAILRAARIDLDDDAQLLATAAGMLP
jgi:hypothetical protein